MSTTPATEPTFTVQLTESDIRRIAVAVAITEVELMQPALDTSLGMIKRYTRDAYNSLGLSLSMLIEGREKPPTQQAFLDAVREELREALALSVRLCEIAWPEDSARAEAELQSTLRQRSAPLN